MFDFRCTTVIVCNTRSLYNIREIHNSRNCIIIERFFALPFCIIMYGQCITWHMCMCLLVFIWMYARLLGTIDFDKWSCMTFKASKSNGSIYTNNNQNSTIENIVMAQNTDCAVKNDFTEHWENITPFFYFLYFFSPFIRMYESDVLCVSVMFCKHMSKRVKWIDTYFLYRIYLFCSYDNNNTLIKFKSLCLTCVWLVNWILLIHFLSLTESISIFRKASMPSRCTFCSLKFNVNELHEKSITSHNFNRNMFLSSTLIRVALVIVITSNNGFILMPHVLLRCLVLCICMSDGGLY